MSNNCKYPEMCILSDECVPCAICPNAKEKADDRLALTPCSALPETAGFFWWRKYPDQEWRMVHIVDFAAGYPGESPHLAAYDIEFRAWGGRTLRMWAIHEPIGEWLPICKPNARAMTSGDGVADESKLKSL
jgi:hypothetical protein